MLGIDYVNFSGWTKNTTHENFESLKWGHWLHLRPTAMYKKTKVCVLKFLGANYISSLVKVKAHEHKSHFNVCEQQLTYRWCEEYKHSVAGTPGPPWWDVHAGQGRASHGAAQEKDSSEEPRVPEKCQSLTALQYRMRKQVCNSSRNMLCKGKQRWCLVNPAEAVLSSVPVTGRSRRSTEDGLLMSARNLYRSSSLSLSPSYRTIQNIQNLTAIKHTLNSTSPICLF